MQGIQSEACGFCTATATISWGSPGEPVTVRVEHAPTCEWLPQGADLSGDASVVHTRATGGDRR